jgi:hypothetical protein
MRLISTHFHPSTTQCVVATWNREAQSCPNEANDILPWRKYIKLATGEISGYEIHFWPSNGWILDRHGCLPILLVDLLARIGREGKKMVLIKTTF